MRRRSRAAALALLLAACNGAFYHPSRKVHGDAARAGYVFADHTFPSGSGHSLHGRFFMRREGLPRKGLWIFFHGNSRNLTGSYSAYAWVVNAGWDYFVFDYSGYGRSQGSAAREALHRDGIAALDYAARTFPMGPGEALVATGESLGGAVLLASAADWEGRRGLSLLFVDCTFPSYRDAAQAVMAERPYAWPFQLLGRWLVSDAHAPARGLARLAGIPLLVSHCRDDREIPYRLGESLYAQAPGPKRFWPLEGCGHTRGFTDRFPGNRARLLAFVGSVAAPARRP